MNIYDNPEYWKGDIGYRGEGYGDFAINRVKEACILLRRPKDILDVGCAYGFTVAKLRSLGFDAWGIDISNYALSKASKEVREFLTYASVCDMKVMDKPFDFIYSSGVLEHIPKKDLDKAISEIVRVGKRGLIGVSCLDDKTTHDNDDETHEVILNKSEWQAMFPPWFEIVSDSAEAWVELLRKDIEPINALLEGLE